MRKKPARNAAMAPRFDQHRRPGLIALTVAGATLAWGHDEAASPHVSCALDGEDTLICLYERHPTGAARQSRAGYADKGRYVLSCPSQEDSDNRSFTLEVCRAGTGTKTSFECWTQVRRTNWLAEDDQNAASAREQPTQVHTFQGSGLQETLLKLLADPAAFGRPHFVAQDGITSGDMEAYAATCGLATDGALTPQDVANLLPTLKVFGSPRPHRGGNEAAE